MRILEAYSEGLRLDARKRSSHCAICHIYLPPDAACDLHSGTSLHLRRVLTPRGQRFLVTSPPEGHKVLKGRTLDLQIWPFDTETDGVLLCIPCHVELGNMARAEARRRGYRGQTPPPQILTELTVFAIRRGKPLNYDLKC